MTDKKEPTKIEIPEWLPRWYPVACLVVLLFLGLWLYVLLVWNLFVGPVFRLPMLTGSESAGLSLIVWFVLGVLYGLKESK